MKLTGIERDWQVFAREGAVGIGAVRQVAERHLTIYIEGYGDARITADQIAAVHDAKVVLRPDRLPEELAAAVAHAHDRETSRN